MGFRRAKLWGYPQCYKAISGLVHFNDIEWDQKQMGMAEEYLNQAEELLLVSPKSGAMQITMQASSFEIFSFVPIMKFS